MKVVAFACYGSSLGAIIYMGVSGERWPLAFLSTMVAFGIVIGAAALLIRGRGNDDDR